MRASGAIQCPASPAVHDHLAWTGEGAVGLSLVARQVFGLAQPGERLVLVADGSPCGLEDDYAADLESGRLVTMSARDTYAPVLDGVPNAAGAQLQQFDDFVADALRSGYSGLRVVADNTEMLTGTDEQARNWLAWEQLTDGWQTQQPVNGNCYFDRDRVDPLRLDSALRRHPATVGSAVPWRVFYEQDDAGRLRLALAGEVEAFDAPDVTTALAASLDLDPAGQPLALTLRETDYLHHTIPFALAALAHRGPGLHVTEVSAAVARLLRYLPPLPGFAAR